MVDRGINVYRRRSSPAVIRDWTLAVALRSTKDSQLTRSAASYISAWSS
jgi:hypothetical protein